MGTAKMLDRVEVLTMRPAGYFGRFGGQFVGETLMPVIEELVEAYDNVRWTEKFQSDLAELSADFIGRPTPLYFARRLSEEAGGARIFIKREDLNHTGAHKINNAIGQALLAKHMCKKRVIAETGAGQHGVACATACALMGLQCEIYMGQVDVDRQQQNVARMNLLGAKVNVVHDGARTLKDAVSAAIQDWMTNVDDTYYLLGSIIGPHPFPQIVSDFQSVIGIECRRQILAKQAKLPDAVVACVGGGSNSIGIFSAFLEDPVRLYGVQAGGHDGFHSAPVLNGRPGVLHGTHSYFLQTRDGQVQEAESIAPGLDYPGVGPQHAHFRETGRVEYRAVSDQQALDATVRLSRTQGIIPALESAHAVHATVEIASSMTADQSVIVNLSGRGDKDLTTILDRLKHQGEA
jgi:tryptophan synthase beta chain